MKKIKTKRELYEKEKNKRILRLEKIRSDYLQKSLERYEKLKMKYSTIKEKKIIEISLYYDRKLEKAYNKANRRSKQVIHKKREKIYGRDVEIIKKIGKKEALAEIQLYSKLSRCKINELSDCIDVFLMDKLVRVPWYDLKTKKSVSTIVGGHVYSQHNYPQLAFDIRNIRPITYSTNKIQGTETANWKKNLSKEDQIYLDTKSYGEKKLRDGNYFREQYNKFKELNKNLKKNLGIN